MMAEPKHRCRLYFQIPAPAPATLNAQLADAMAGTDAACVLLCREESAFDDVQASSLIDVVQARGVACLVEQDAGLAERLGADGVHIAADAAVYAETRKLLGESASIGAFCGMNRHDAMRLAELGADYVAFGGPDGTIDAIDQYADLIAWWSEIFVVPCVAWNVDNADHAARLASLGADFVAPSKRIWQADDALALIAEIDSAVRQSRRAA
jgi:thiamine-phosphate pyrophosphorylase